MPESLGNHTLILRRGIVCDGCNNYFSRKVEGPFLGSPAIRLLRHEQGLISKKGRIPTFRAVASGVEGVTMHARTPELPRRIIFDSEEMAHRWLISGGRDAMISREIISRPSASVTSRFLAKLAVGCLADRLQDTAGGLDVLVDDPVFERIRNHARRGTDRQWPVSVRQIYPADARWREHGEVSQKVWELDLFVDDDDGRTYSVFILFGLEFTIHIDEPDISCYRRWLIKHGGDSPLYSGRYAQELTTRFGVYNQDRWRAVVGYQDPVA